MGISDYHIQILFMDITVFLIDSSAPLVSTGLLLKICLLSVDM